MAEFVQLRKEKWVDTVDALRKLEILKTEECNSFLKTIDSHEYKIQTPNRKLENVLGYIQFLCDSLKYIQRRRKVLKQFEKTGEVDRFIYNEISSQFGSAEINFGHKTDFWNARLKYVATIVPEQDRENEFNRVSRKALQYCAAADLSFYKYCVDFEWSLLKLPPAQRPASKKRKRVEQRRDYSKLMSAIRGITLLAQRNFPQSVEASIWVMTTEMKYLCVLKEEKENFNATDDSPLPFDINEETEKTERMLQVLYEEFKKRHEILMSYCQLYEAIREFNILQATQLLKDIIQHILSGRPRPLQVSSWLIRRNFEENKIDECLERITEAISISDSKVKAAGMCMETIMTFFQKLNSLEVSGECLSKLIQYSMNLFHQENSEWCNLTSKTCLTSRVQFIKKLSMIYDSALVKKLNEELRHEIKSFLNDHPLEKIVLKSVKLCPSNFILARERIHYLLTQADKSAKSRLICSYLSAIDWKDVEEADATALLNFVYRSFKMSAKLKKKKIEMEKLFKLPIQHPAMDHFRILHLKLTYMEDADLGGELYRDCSAFSSDWRLPCTVLKIETDRCRSLGEAEISPVFSKAIVDAQRLGDVLSTEPWKICVTSFRTLGMEKEASQVLERALDKFNRRKDSTAMHHDLVLFSKSLKRLN